MSHINYMPTQITPEISMNKIFNYMFKKYIVGFFLTVIILVSINLLIIFLSEIKNLGVHDYNLEVLAQYVLLLIPQNFLDIFPYSLLIGSMIAFGSMAYHSEIIAMNAHGIGIKKTVLFIILQTFILATFFTFLGNHYSPNLSMHAQEIKNTALKKNVMGTDMWFKGNDYIVNTKSMITDKQLKDIEIFYITDGKVSSILTAEEAFYKNQWVLNNVQIVDIDANQKINKEIHNISTDQFIPFQILQSKFNKKRYLSLEDLYSNIIFYNDMGIYYEDHKVIFWQKILLPFSCSIIVFIGLPFLFVSIRSKNQSQRILFGILFGITYFVISSMIINIGLILSIPALLSVMISMIVFVLFGYFLFTKLVKSQIPI